MPRKRLSKLDEVEREFGEPIEKIYQILSAIGFSKRGATAALGWHPRAAGRILKIVDPAGAIAWPSPNRSWGRANSPRRSPSAAVRNHHRTAGRHRLRCLEIDGRECLIVELFELAQRHPDLTLPTFRKRLLAGWSLARALTTPPRRTP